MTSEEAATARGLPDALNLRAASLAQDDQPYETRQGHLRKWSATDAQRGQQYRLEVVGPYLYGSKHCVTLTSPRCPP